MENIAEVMKIIEAGLQQDQTKVFNYSQLLVNKLENTGDAQTADKLKKILKNIKTLTIRAQGYEQILKSPVDTESRLPLAEIKQYTKDSIFLSVSQNIKTDIQEFISLLNNADLYINKGIKTHRSLLLFGLPGTGKSQAAKYIASQTNLPLVTIRIDGLVSSYLGNTSKNIRALFDFVEKTPCILFLDEFDAIAKMRDDSNELGELKRVVNTLLQNIDSIESKVPVIAATNHEHLLDPAVWRRFDYKIKMELPDSEQREKLVKEFLFMPENEKINNILVEMTKEFSGAEIEAFCNQIKTNIVMDKQSYLREEKLIDYYIKFRNRNSKGDEPVIDNSDNSKMILAKSFREQNEKVFTIRTLSELTGISVGKISQDLNTRGDSDGRG